MKKYIAILACACVLCACSEEVLEKANPNALVSSNAWQTQADVEAGLTGAYHVLYNSFYNSMNGFQLSGQSDEFYSQSPDSGLAGYVNHIYNNYSQNWNNSTWKYLYQSVFRANQVIIHADEVEWASDAEYRDVMAQARCLRGMHYYYLANFYEHAPWVDWISSPSDQAEQTPYETLVANAEADLKYAAENLKESYGTEVGRLTKYAAYTWLGKLYMNATSELGDAYWAKAAAAFKVVINSGKYRLVDNWADNFMEETENNAESIFEIQHLFSSNWFPGYYGIANDGAECSYGCYREKFMAGSPFGWGDYAVYDWVVDMYKDELDLDGNLDQRLKFSVCYDTDNVGGTNIFEDNPGIVIGGNTVWNQSTWGTQNWVMKYTTMYTGAERSNWNNGINTRILRYGELILSYAECIVHANGASAIPEAAGYVDQIRARVNFAPLAESKYADCLKSASAFLKQLEWEREKEIFSEYDRFFDLRRYGIGKDASYLKEVQDRCGKYATNWKPGHQWLPIPTNEVTNNPNLDQVSGF